MKAIGWITAVAVLLMGCSFEGLSGVSSDGSGFAEPELRAAGFEVAAYRSSTTIPDGNPEGLILGPVSDGNARGVLSAVCLMVDLHHPNTADVALRLCYDQDNDGLFEVEADVEFFRASRDGWAGAPTNACPQSLDGAYYFRAVELGDDPLDLFRGLPGGGSFHLVVADTLSKDVGILRHWSVRVECASASSRIP